MRFGDLFGMFGRVAAAAGVVGAAALACTETEIQYQDHEPFNPPPNAAAGFLG